MIYVDTSVLLAHVLSEDRAPPRELWSESLIASRLVEYEVWNRLGALDATDTVREVARLALSRLAFVELVRPVVSRAASPFPTRARTLDALHLASIDFLREQGQDVRLATYDRRMEEAARGLGISIHQM